MLLAARGADIGERLQEPVSLASAPVIAPLRPQRAEGPRRGAHAADAEPRLTIAEKDATAAAAGREPPGHALQDGREVGPTPGSTGFVRRDVTGRGMVIGVAC